MAFELGTKANIAFKRSLGKIHTANDRDPANEPAGTKVLMSAQDVWARSINLDPLSTENDGVIARGETGDPHGKGEDDRLVLELDPISGTDAEAGTYSGFYVRVPAGGVPNQLQGVINPFTGVAFASGDRVGNIVPGTFGFNLRPRVYNGSDEVPPSDASDWFLDAYAGVFTQEDDEAPKMIDYTVSGGYLHCYVYIGDYVTDKLQGLGGGTTYQFYENQTIGDGVTGTIDGINKDFDLDNTPIAESVQVYLNGMLQEQGSDYTISGNTISFTEAPEVVVINAGEPGEESYPDKIVVSYRTNT